jgi:8-oxo-dGTP pyrophosphatase MutT (NUDIX family)
VPIAEAPYSENDLRMLEDLADQLHLALATRTPQIATEWKSRPAAVLVPLFEVDGEWRLLYTQRTDDVDAHPGQVSFPGGAIEADDGTPAAAALREAQEEIGLTSDRVRILGEMNPMLTVTQFLVTPVVAQIEWPFSMKINPSEVAATFHVPFSFLADPDNLETRRREPLIPGRAVEVLYFRPYDGQVIWGVTARITVDLLDLIRSL